jgi:nicotinamidase-related amidase
MDFHPMDFHQVDPRKAALVVVDMVNWQVHPDGGYVRHFGDQPGTAYMARRSYDTIVPNLRRLIPACRKVGARIVHLRVGSAVSDFQDVPPSFRESFKKCGAIDGSWACQVIDELAVEPGDTSLLKTGSGGFGASALDQRLRLMDISHVIYTGVVTHACVLLTLAGGFDLGYQGALISDATAAFSDDMQAHTEAIVGIYMAKVMSTDQMVEALTVPRRK